MGEYNGVVGGVAGIITQEFKPWWNGIDGTIDPIFVEGREITTEEAFKAVLDWRVELEDVFTFNPAFSGYEAVQGKKATVKVESTPLGDIHTVLGIVSDGFGVTQNVVIKEFADAIKAQGDVYVKSAGGLFDWKQVWMLLKLGEDKYFSDGGEQVQRYLLISTGHDGSLKLTARPTNVRVECMNTFDWAISKSQAVVSLKHTSKVEDRYETAKQVLREAYDHFNALDLEIAELLNTEFSRTRYQDSLVPKLLGDKPENEGRALTNYNNKRDGLVASYEREDQRNIQGTGWGAVMAVNSYEQWGQSVRGQSRAEMQARRAVKGDFPLTSQARELVLASN